MPEGCGEDVGDRCRSGGYGCRVTALTPDSVMGRCALRADPFRALAFEYVYPL